MVRRALGPHDGVMTDQPPPDRATPGSETGADGPTGTTATATHDRVNSEHLRDYSTFRRSTTDRKLAGVAGGLGRHLNIDPTIVRVLLVVLIFFGGAGLILYGAAWLLVPEDDGSPAMLRVDDRARNTLLVIVAVVAALAVVGDSWGGLDFPWPIALIALGVFWVLARRENRAQPEPVDDPAGYPLGQATGQSTAYQYSQTLQGWQPVVPSVVRTKPQRKGPVLFGITLALLAVGLGVLGIVDASTGDVSDGAYPALALAIIGAMLVLGAFWGRAGGLAALGVLATLALPVVSIGQPSFHGDRDVVVKPTSAAALASTYDIPAGRVKLDLTHVADLSALAGQTVHVHANAGQVEIVVPAGLSVALDSEIHWAGAIDTPDKSVNGFDPELRRTMTSSAADAPTLNIEVDLDFGHVELRQAA
jgi:phage shock protein PspC (stress-responsive transcriptional regulator)